MAKIFISLGSNIDPEHHLKAALTDLTDHFGELEMSSVFESEAVGFEGSNFLNMVVAAQTELSIEEVVSTFKLIEQAHGRVKGAKKFAPRTLDLDLLLFDDTVSQQPIELPRAEILYNAFVLWPLAEIAPSLNHPVVKQSYQTLWGSYDKSQQSLWPVEFNWSA
ncbi:2-amino-4-hydroxy-6-hydroxymethyldihydropteridine diphosphokinase [Shewanella schlegeliana]|uniref:2-amino-4-hydroxy-6-hydroxymethyldihydropteridine diphosphokinase n=1 Tax=Shewanella schlegeliana TaxID=190308 RepID=A0ABS1SV89_9GAMM|nr:2-amino-4-hydroxy-6-hydroxymethyldihydropteridine diphosphokinase [Shewanella schlegeliana]MBL4912250.1 2-amino-4-hydroxy-6-hydroxymethyldihydropteridine diphosphokinase [Shewanella schlegeliana]MCL1110663.1 2-amino-4-hydroxy-6-hydroxymethyldihydropteridine diphosphokinase [Shewanella schlegeliana]GIU22467.1 2-amino-4-hydroxy-6-hydroxymethyldihydropteridine diphosphokinase [Shewanella schlegeliana]